MSSTLRRRAAFTLVELLVVIGIIALLISVLLPALNKARESANAVKCASNLRTIGQGLVLYVAENRNTFPAAYLYAGPSQVTPNEGYIHWSSYLYGDKLKRGTMAVFQNLQGWDAFQCPSFEGGGLPPANTYAANVGAGVQVDVGGVVDQQSPRLAYTVNEAIMPRNKFSDEDGKTTRPETYVRAAMIKNSAGTVLATEFSQNPAMAADVGNVNSGVQVCKSHRPVHGFVTASNGWNMNEMPVSAGGVPTYRRSYDVIGGLSPAPSLNRYAWIGRNHGKATLNTAGQDMRRTNFLYVDGHVETKRLCETIYPTFQWGEQFYSLRDRGGFQLTQPTSSQVAQLK